MPGARLGTLPPDSHNRMQTDLCTPFFDPASLSLRCGIIPPPILVLTLLDLSSSPPQPPEQLGYRCMPSHSALPALPYICGKRATRRLSNLARHTKCNLIPYTTPAPSCSLYMKELCVHATSLVPSFLGLPGPRGPSQSSAQFDSTINHHSKAAMT